MSDDCVVLTLREDVNLRAAMYLSTLTVDDLKVFNPTGGSKRCKSEKDFAAAHSSLKRYLENVLNVETVTREYRYARGKTFGRMFSSGVQQLWRDFRGLLCKHTTDIDMKNAHPVILLWMCDKFGIPCDALRKYVSHRDTILEEMQLITGKDREECKRLFLVATNMNQEMDPWGCIDMPFFHEYDAEIKVIQVALMELDDLRRFREYANVDRGNEEGSFVNLVLCYSENELIQCCREYLAAIGIETMCINFDGLMVYGDHYGNNELLDDLFKLLHEKFAIEMRFDYKKHSDRIVIPDSFQPLCIGVHGEFVKNISEPYFIDAVHFERILAGLRGEAQRLPANQRGRWRAAMQSLLVRVGKTDEDVNQVWDASFDRNLDGGVLAFYSRESNSDNHAHICATELGLATKTIFKETELRDYFVMLWADNAMCFYGRKELSVWSEGRWRVDLDGAILGHTLINSMHVLFASILSYWTRALKTCPKDDDTRAAMIKGRLSQIASTALGYGNNKNRNVRALIVEQLRARPHEVDPFDQQRHVFAFTNVAFNLHSKEFFTPHKYDFLLMNCGKEWRTPSESECEKVRALYESVFPDPDFKRSYVSILHSGLSGVRPENFAVATGGGRNGKGMLNENFMYLLGDYGTTGHLTTLTRPIKDGPNTEIRSLHRKRFILYSEPEEGMSEKLRLSNIKKLTGDEKIKARGLYESDDKTEIFGTQVMECNRLPAIAGEKGEAAVKRVVMVLFETTFTDDPVQIAKDPKKYKLIDPSLKTPTFMEDHYCANFKYIVDNARDLSLYLPKKTRDLGQEYLEKNDELALWFNDTYEKEEAEPVKNFVSIKDMFHRFTSSPFYTELSRAEKRRFTQTAFKEEIQRNIVLKHFYRDERKVSINGKRNTRAGVVHYKPKPKDDDDEDDFGNKRMRSW